MLLSKKVTAAILLIVLSLVPVTVYAQATETASGENALQQYASRFHPAISNHGMVAAQEKIAAQVGRDILADGGNAVDAAVAVGFALAVTHPQAGNIGGGGFMVIAFGDGRQSVALDFREKAPQAAERDMFLGADGDVDNEKARFSHLSAGVPGSVMGLTTALERFGTMPLKRVMAPAIKLAVRGVPVEYGLHGSLSKSAERLHRDPSSVSYFLSRNGNAPAVGEKLVQKDLGKTLKRIAKKGAAGFYEGETADLIVAEMQANGGLISHDDLKKYEAVWRRPVAGRFRDYDIVSMPPPASGGIHVIEMLNILEGYDLKAMGHNSAAYLHKLVEAMRRAYADRSAYLGDPDFYDVPIAALTDKAYAQQLRDSIHPKWASKSSDIRPGLGTPKPESPQTTHYSVMDDEGNAVAVTTTLNFAYGGGYSVDGAGFLLNNEMDDFSAKPGAPNGFGLIGGVANQIEPGKRPLSSMTPTIVLKEGRPYIVTGSPGGSTIITIVLQMILNMLEFDMNPLEATAAPRIHHQWLPDLVFYESGISPDTTALLKRRGFKIQETPQGRPRIFGRTNTIQYKAGFFYGASDPRGPKGAVLGVEKR